MGLYLGSEKKSKVNLSGYKAGKQAEYDRFWDSYQQNGSRADYSAAFAGGGWDKNTFKPKYDIKPTNAYMVFRYFNKEKSDIDLEATIKSLGITLDFSKVSNGQYAFYYAKVTRLGVIDFSNTTTSSFGSTFEACYGLVTIDKLCVNSAGTHTFSRTFYRCDKLANISIEGVIGQSISFEYSPLTVESMKSVINALKDYTGTSTAYTLTFRADRETMLTEEEKAVATNKGWTLVWA